MEKKNLFNKCLSSMILLIILCFYGCNSKSNVKGSTPDNTVNVWGRVTEVSSDDENTNRETAGKGTRIPITDEQVEVSIGNQQAKTDKNGFFEIKNLAFPDKGRLKVEFTHLNGKYSRYTKILEIDRGGDYCVYGVMQLAQIPMQEIPENGVIHALDSVSGKLLGQVIFPEGCKGKIQMCLSDPTKPERESVDDFQAKSEDGKDVSLQTVGTVNIEGKIEVNEGEFVSIKIMNRLPEPYQTGEYKNPLTQELYKEGDTVFCWELNYDEGIWKQVDAFPSDISKYDSDVIKGEDGLYVIREILVQGETTPARISAGLVRFIFTQVARVVGTVAEVVDDSSDCRGSLYKDGQPWLMPRSSSSRISGIVDEEYLEAHPEWKTKPELKTYTIKYNGEETNLFGNVAGNIGSVTHFLLPKSTWARVAVDYGEFKWIHPTIYSISPYATSDLKSLNFITGKVSGYVRKADTGEPYPGEVIITNFGQKIATDARGYYEFKGVPTGNALYTLNLSYWKNSARFQLTTTQNTKVIDFVVGNAPDVTFLSPEDSLYYTDQYITFKASVAKHPRQIKSAKFNFTKGTSQSSTGNILLGPDLIMSYTTKLEAGIYYVVAEVEDEIGCTQKMPLDHKITIKDSATKFNISYQSSNGTYAAPVDITITATPDNADTIKEVRFFKQLGTQSSELIGIAKSQPYECYHQFATSGTYNIKAIGVEISGRTCQPVEKSLTLTNANSAITIDFYLSSNSNAPYWTGETVSVVADARDPNGMSRVTLNIKDEYGRLVYTNADYAYPYRWDWYVGSTIKSGKYYLSAMATNQNGYQKASQTLQIEVYKPGPSMSVSCDKPFKSMTYNGYFDLGIAPRSKEKIYQFSIVNWGEANLSVPSVQIKGSNKFKISKNPSTSISPNNYSFFHISFNSTTEGEYKATIGINSNDPNVPSNGSSYSYFIFQIKCTCRDMAPDMNVSGKGDSPDNYQLIANGDTSPNKIDGTDFGDVTLYRENVYRISNPGEATLTISKISLPDSGEFTVSKNPGSKVDPGGYTEFTVLFKPKSSGYHTTRVQIENDTANNPYEFAIRGFAYIPRMEVTGKDVVIANGDTTPTKDDDTDFGNTRIYETTTHSFTIHNKGEGILKVDEIRVASGEFKIIQPSSFPFTIDPGSSLPLRVKFAPASTGTKSGGIYLYHYQGTYWFTVQGVAVQPQMVVKGNNVVIANGDASPSADDDTDFGSVQVGSTHDHIFTIQNMDAQNLYIGSVTLNEMNNDGSSNFQVISEPTSPISPNGSTTFTVRYKPGSVYYKTAMVSILCNAGDQSFPYEFKIAGGMHDGDLDIGFGYNGLDIGSRYNGLVIRNLGGNDYGNAVVIDKQGRIVVAGETSGKFALIRLQENGDLDTSFGTSGIVKTTISSGNREAIRCIKIDDNNNLVVTGHAKISNQLVVVLARYKENGTLDASFGTNGIVITDLPTIHEMGKSLGLQDDGKIIVACGGGPGEYSFDTCAWIRYNTDGSVDKIVTTPLGATGGIEALALQGDGKAVLAGWKSAVSIMVMRYDTDGNLDNSFGISGIATVTLDRPAACYSVAIQSDGKIITAGSKGSGSYRDFCLIRFNSDGTVDNSFGIVTTDFDSKDNVATSVALQSDGKIVASGYTFSQGVPLARYTKDGYLDTFFGKGGKAFNGWGNSGGNAMAIQSDSKIVVAGYSDANFLIYRYFVSPIGPEISVEGKGLEISDGDTTPDASDDTDFELLTPGNTLEHTFTIKNSGISDLTLTLPITINGSTDLTVTKQPASIIPKGMSDTFTVTFAPISGGVKNGKLLIKNNDNDKNPYGFVVQGTGAIPEIMVKGNKKEILDGSTTPTTEDDTEFGNTKVTGGLEHTFTIDNTGTETLNISSVKIIGSTEFTISQQPQDKVNGGSYTTFAVTFSPESVETKSATVSIENDDGDENPYDFKIQGTGCVPDIVITGKGIEIPNDDASPDVADGTEWGNVSINTTKDSTFTIKNTGQALLLITNVTINGPAEFTIAQKVTNTIVPGGSSDFIVRFAPVSCVSKAAFVQVNSDKSEKNPYTFKIQGKGVAPEISVTGKGIEIPDGKRFPVSDDDTYFGETSSEEISRTFTIHNSGTDILNLSLSLSGATEFTITQQPAATVNANSSTNFTIRFKPSLSDVKSTLVEIKNNDATENPYDFSIQAKAIGPDKAINPNPANGAGNVPRNQVLSWTGAGNTTGYDVFLGTSPANLMLKASNIGIISYDPNPDLATETTYYWRIDSLFNSTRTTGDVWSFSTGKLPGKATNPTPANNAYDVSVSTSLSWAAGAQATGYDVYLGKGSMSMAKVASNIGNTSYTPVSALEPGTNYYWRVNSLNDIRQSRGQATGDIWIFHTEPAPYKATIYYPPNNATGVYQTAELSWYSGAYTKTHNLYLGTRPDQLTKIAEIPAKLGGYLKYKVIPTFKQSTTYYWRIDSLKGPLTTTGEVWKFTTSTEILHQYELNGTYKDERGGRDLVKQGGTFVENNTKHSFTKGNSGLYLYLDNFLENYTIEIVLRMDVIPDYQAKLIDFRNLTSINGLYILNQNGTCKIRFESPQGGIGNTSLALGKFYTVCLTRTSSYKRVRIYVNGQEDLTFNDYNGHALFANQYARFFKSTDAAYYEGTGVVDRIIMWSQAVEPPRQAINPTPSDNANNVDLTQILSWQLPTRSTSEFDVYLGTDPNDLTGVGSNITATSFKPDADLKPNTTYYWRIDSLNTPSVTPGIVWSFKTNGMPGKATNPNPAHNSTGVSLAQVLSWTGDNAAGYDVYIGTDPNNLSKEASNISSTSYDPELSMGTTYYWRIDSLRETYVTQGDVWAFTAGSIPGKVTNPNPDNGAINVPLSKILSWTAGPYATGYDVYFGADPTNLPKVASNISATSYDPDLVANTKYYWRVDSVNATRSRRAVVTGDIWNFTTGKLPGKVTNANPANNATNVPLAQVLSWSAGAYATGYDVYLGTNPNSLSKVASNIGMTSYNPDPDLLPGTTYYWRIDSLNATRRGRAVITGDVWSFSTAKLPGKATNPNPANNATKVPLVQVLSWTPGTDTTGSDVYFGTDPNNLSKVVSNTSATSYDPDLIENTTYYWRIDSLNSTRAVTTGDAWTFTTGKYSAKATDPNPADNASNIPLAQILSWTAASEATGYDVYFGIDPNGLPKLASNISATSYDPNPDLTVETTYYWRIDSINATKDKRAVTTGDVWTFTTGKLPGKATNPVPANNATNIPIAQILSWTASTDTTGYDVYMGTDAGNLPKVASNISATSHDPNPDLTANTIYYWRIDSINATKDKRAVTTGDVWTFTTQGISTSYIYWANYTGTIATANIDGSGANQNFITGCTSPVGVLVTSQYIYWTNRGTADTIGRANIDGTGVNQNFITGCAEPTGLAINAQYIYWTNWDSNSVGRANIDGTGANQNFITGCSGTGGLAINANYIYWTNWNYNSIGRANIDGTGVNQNFITSGCSAPNGLAINANYIYWTNWFVKKISKANLDGTGANQNFITSGCNGPCGLALTSQYIHWANYFDNNIYRANLDGSSPSLFISGCSSPEFIAVSPGSRVVLVPSIIGAGFGHSSRILSKEETIQTWGLNNYEQCNEPVGYKYKAVSLGYNHTFALTSDGSLVTWGDNIYGQCYALSGNDFTAISAGYFHNLALKSDGSIASWGRNDEEQCNAPTDPGYQAIAAGGMHSLAINRDGSLVAWGDNTFGQTNVPTGTGFKAIAAGYAHSVALKEDGSLVIWGKSGYDASSMPTGKYLAIAAGQYYTVAIKQDGSLEQWGLNTYQNMPTDAGYVQITFGCTSGLSLKNDGSLASWGTNAYCQLDIPEPGQASAKVPVGPNIPTQCLSTKELNDTLEKLYIQALQQK